MTNRTPSGESPSLAARLRNRLRSIEPMHVALLGLLAIPGYVFESLAVLQFFALFFLAFFWPFVAPLVDLVLRRGADEDAAAEPTDWIYMGSWREYAAWYLMLPLTFLNPLVLAQDTMQLLGGAVAAARHRGSVPDDESYEQRRSYRLPFDGTWTVVNGSHDRDHSHSWYPVTQRYAYDFVITDADGRTSPEDSGIGVESYYCYDEPILAPADGVVVDVSDTDLESARAGGFSHPLKRDIRGNYVVIQHAPDEYSCLAHLVPGSVTVAPGDRVARGQRIGRCGHSGNSSEPHLHFQLQDHPDFEIAAGLPVEFDDVAIEWPGVETPIGDSTDAPLEAGENDASDGGFEDATDGTRSAVTAGQRLVHVGRDDDAPRRDRGDHGGVAPGSDAALAGSIDRRRAGLETLQRVAFGVCVGGVVTYFVSIVASWAVVAALLGGGAVLGAAYRVGFRLLRADGYERRPGSIGTVVGVGIVAVTVVRYGSSDPTVGVGLLALGVSAFLTGFVGYVALGEYDRLRLRDSFGDADAAVRSA